MARKSRQNTGCLGMLLALFGITPAPQGTGPLPYRLRDDFLSPAEANFYRVLCQAVGHQVLVCPKVNLADIFYVTRPNENRAAMNRIDRKHVDFLLCDSQTLRPVLGLELDDSSHQRASRQERDRLVDSVFEVAGLPLGHVRVQAHYEVAGLVRWLTESFGLPLGVGGPQAAAAAPLPPTRTAANVATGGTLPGIGPTAAPALRTPPAAPAVAPAAAPVRGVAEPELSGTFVPPVSPTASSMPLCPKCGVPMVLREATRGERKGERFYGCPNFPKCYQRVPVGGEPGGWSS